ncbi:MAG: cupin domain-containing protein [Ectothiorhodospiraceae bacterium]|nr:cupin domain-containing protein [Ectothiorhodospiraceae bacterium]
MEKTLTLLGERSAEVFLKDYWQKRPLLIQNAIPGFQCPITPDELAGLACEDDVESRLIQEHSGPSPWSVEHGPLDENRFSDLPETHWTLLVQECNRYVPELAALLKQFNFIPHWRVDDVMASYAPAQGSVGPHTDQYDVFLLQAFGTRRWQISQAPVTPDNQLPGLDLCIMREFIAEQEWLLQPGDMLYLPPGVAHHGVAQEDCITLSIGFRAPSHAEIITSFSDFMAEQLDASQRYSDPHLILQKDAAEISPAALKQVRDIIHSTLADDAAITQWFGQYITEAKSTQPHTVENEPLSLQQFLQHYKQAGTLFRNEDLRFAYSAPSPSESATLYIDGHCFALNSEVAFAATLLCNHDELNYPQMQTLLNQPAFANLLHTLYNLSYVYFEDA